MKVQLNDIRAKNTWEGKEPEHHSPALNYCRKLLKEGIAPTERLDIYRGEQLAYSVKSIGEGAKWKVHEDSDSGPYFKKYRANPGWHLKGVEKGVPAKSHSDLND